MISRDLASNHAHHENTKMKVTSFDLYAIPNADDAQRCRIEIKCREQEAADSGEHFILCGRKLECRWDYTMSALINRLKTACCAVGNVVKRLVLVTSLLLFLALIDRVMCEGEMWVYMLMMPVWRASLSDGSSSIPALEDGRWGWGRSRSRPLASLPLSLSLRNPFFFPVKAEFYYGEGCFFVFIPRAFALGR